MGSVAAAIVALKEPPYVRPGPFHLDGRALPQCDKLSRSAAKQEFTHKEMLQYGTEAGYENIRMVMGFTG